MEVWRPKVLLLGPGGVKGFLLLGSLLFLEKVKFLKDVKKVVGISVGSMAGLLYITGYTITEILEFAIMTQIIDISTIDVINIMKKNGLVSHESFRKRLRDKITEKYGFVPTLKQLYLMTGYEFEVVVTNLDKDTTEYFSHITEPDLCCVEAVLMSISIPLIFQSYVYKNNIYLDGAISQAFPIQRYKDENVFAVMLKGSRSDPKESFFSYLYHIVKLLTSITEKNLDVPPNTKILHLNYQVDDTIGVKLTFDKKVEMFLYGYYRAYDFYKKLNSQSNEHFPIDYNKVGSKELFSSFRFSKSVLKNNKTQDHTFVGKYYVQKKTNKNKKDVYLDLVEDVGDEYLMELFEDSDSTDFSVTDDSNFESSSEEEYEMKNKLYKQKSNNLTESIQSESDSKENIMQESIQEHDQITEEHDTQEKDDVVKNSENEPELEKEQGEEGREQGREQGEQNMVVQNEADLLNKKDYEKIFNSEVIEKEDEPDLEKEQGEEGRELNEPEQEEIRREQNEPEQEETQSEREFHLSNDNINGEIRRHSSTPISDVSKPKKKKKKHKTPDWIGRGF